MERLERYPRGSNAREQVISEVANKIDESDITEKTIASVKLIQRIGEEEKQDIREDLIFILQKLNLSSLKPSILKNEYLKIIKKQAEKRNPFPSIGDVWKVGEKIVPLLPQKPKTQQEIRDAWVRLADTLGNKKEHKMFEYAPNDSAELKIARLLNRAENIVWNLENSAMKKLTVSICT